MKKNVMMRVAAMLLVCVLASTCGISGTFAKYVSQGNAGDSARVAKWGVVVTGNSDIFADAYNKDDDSFTLDTRTVITSGTHATINDLVAPGTTKTDVTVIDISGMPEVATRVTFVGTVNLTGWTLEDSTFYCPLVFTIVDKAGTEVAKIDGFTYNNETELENAIATFINNFSNDYEANTDLSSEAKSEFHLSWSWPYYVSAERDVMDTYLGNQAAADNASTVEINVSCVVEQID